LKWQKEEQIMADENNGLPEGTDTVIQGAARTGDGATVTVEDAVTEREIVAPRGDAQRSAIGGGSAEGGLADRLRSGREKLASQAGDRARGLVTQGLERTAEALANVSRMVGDTADGVEERLGPDYGDYARRAAGAIENAANTIASKDPDELIDDTRNFVRNSPGVALAGAAVVGFVLARLIKSGIAANDDEDDND
jgi:ElaB/YqjD/DUF883 family membrane-anchored ribosome-binding protein